MALFCPNLKKNGREGKRDILVEERKRNLEEIISQKHGMQTDICTKKQELGGACVL